MDVKQMIEETGKTWHFTKGAGYSDREMELQYLALAVGAEAGELQNLVKKMVRRKHHTEGHSSDGLEKDVPHEMIDVLYYIFRMADLLEIDLEKAFTEKMEINRARYNK
ncbi:MAG: nucleotide pyrophosphohydrolase [Candidatus Micrarchaeota archaeon]|nr:nucleotide pyrophosphohydrolase [Candidatus Micrarchaeota archaeon]